MEEIQTCKETITEGVGDPPHLGTRTDALTIMMWRQVIGIRRVDVVGVVIGGCVRRFVATDGVDWDVVTVNVVVMSAGVPGGAIKSMILVGGNVVGVARCELRRRDTVLSEDCGVPAGEVVEGAKVLVAVVFALASVDDLAGREEWVERAERVLPR